MRSDVGTFLFSLDVELAWGIFERGLTRYEGWLRQERAAIRWLLDELEGHGLPATWAIVGHLLLPSCAAEQGRAHPEVLRPVNDGGRRRWDQVDPATDVARDALWYGPDIAEMITSARVPQELGTHTFSHLDAAHPGCTREVFRSELMKCRELHERNGLKLSSIVYPRNHIAFLDVLPEVGIVAYRGREEHWYERLPRRVCQAMTLAQRRLGLTPPTYALDSRGDHLVANLPASMFLYPREGRRRLVPAAVRDRQAVAGIRRAVARREMVHLWLHPYNLVADPSLRETCRTVFREVAQAAECGRLVPRTMADVAGSIRSSATAH